MTSRKIAPGLLGAPEVKASPEVTPEVVLDWNTIGHDDRLQESGDVAPGSRYLFTRSSDGKPGVWSE
jgi:hypothetical protein